MLKSSRPCLQRMHMLSWLRVLLSPSLATNVRDRVEVRNAGHKSPQLLSERVPVVGPRA